MNEASARASLFSARKELWKISQGLRSGNVTIKETWETLEEIAEKLWELENESSKERG